MHFVYLLKSISHPEQLYIGYTNNLKARLRTHNLKQSPHTAKFAPWEIQACFGFKERDKALKFEDYLKTGSGKAFAKNRFW